MPVVNGRLDYLRRVRQEIETWFGGPTLDDVISACGVPADAAVSVDVEEHCVQIKASGGAHIRRMVRTFRRRGTRIEVEHASLAVVEPGSGVGSRILARSVNGYRRLGVQEVEVYADGAPGTKTIGYYVWPLLGFRMKFEEHRAPTIRAAGFTANDSHDLFLSYPEEGPAWWKLEGWAGWCRFDVQEGSLHNDLLDLYLEKRGIDVRGDPA